MARPNVMGNHKCSEAEKGCESARVACLKIDTCQCRFGPPDGLPLLAAAPPSAPAAPPEGRADCARDGLLEGREVEGGYTTIEGD